ncbi:carbohydrate sulfotransferase [Biomphalaria glabrata]
MPNVTFRNRTFAAILFNCLQCILYFYRIDAWDEKYLKEFEYFLNTTIQLERLMSCRNRCRRSQPLLYSGYNDDCSCDVRCPVYRNCCEDFLTECPLVHKESLKRFRHMMDLQVDCLEMANTLAIVGCPHQTNYTRKLINQDSFSDVLDNTPVTDVATGLVFANMEIYNCHMPGMSNLARKWNILALLNYTSHKENIFHFKHYTISEPWYGAPIYVKNIAKCNPSKISLCNNSISLQRQCQSFLPYQLLKNIVYSYSLCQACSVSSRSPFLNYDSKLNTKVFISPDTVLSGAPIDLWIEAKCDMSLNATFSGAVCHFVKCHHQSGFYAHNGTCRKFHLFSIAFQSDIFQLSEHEKDKILNYITFYLTHVLNIDLAGTVRPLMSFYNEEIRQNMSVATFLIDFNSSALEDIFYSSYKHGLSILAAQLRAYVNQQTKTIPGNTNFSLSLWKEVARNEFINNFEWGSDRDMVSCVHF